MNIDRLKLKNFRSAQEISLEFSKRLNLFVGINGSGKSTVLDGLSICLSWLVKRIERDKGRGSAISDSDIAIGEEYSSLSIKSTHGDTSYQWKLVKMGRKKVAGEESQLGEVGTLISSLRETDSERESLPVIAYYPVNRVVGSARPSIVDRDSSLSLEVYENALGGKANYDSLFEWIRQQDDILNEEANSRTQWVRQNRSEIKQQVRKLLTSLKNLAGSENSKRKEFEYLIGRFEKDELIYEEPRFLFREIDHIIEMADIERDGHYEVEKILFDLEYLLHKMSSLSGEHRDNHMGEDGVVHEVVVEKILHNFRSVWSNENSKSELSVFLWETFSFALWLSFWWMSDKGKGTLQKELKVFSKESGPGYSMFFPESVTDNFVGQLRQLIRRELELKENANRNEGRELSVVTGAIEQFVPEYSNLRVTRVPTPRMLIDKKGDTFNLEQLSDGEKNLIALVGDIARRFAMANSHLANPLEGEGVVLIDEIDLHLHPGWQRLVIPQLLKTFPNCQFFLTTHSPQVISHAKPESLFLLSNSETGLEYRKVDETYGMSVDRAVELLMDDESRPEPVKNDLENLFELIERLKLTEAKELVNKLKEHMPTDPELIKAEVLIRREEKR